MIDAWLLFGLIMPFFVFLALCITVLMKDEYVRAGSPFVPIRKVSPSPNSMMGDKKGSGPEYFTFDQMVSKRTFIKASRCCLPTVTVMFVVVYWLVALTYFYSHH